MAGRNAVPRQRAKVCARPTSRHPGRSLRVHPIFFLRAVAGAPHACLAAGYFHHRRYPHLHRARQCGRVGESAPLPARQENAAPHRRRGRASGLFFGRWTAVGQPALRLGSPRRRRLHVVARSSARELRTLRCRAPRPFSWLRCLLGDSGQRPDRAHGQLATGSGHRFFQERSSRDAHRETHRRRPRRTFSIRRHLARGHRTSGYGHSPIRLRRRCEKPLSSAQPAREQRRLPRHARQ